MVQVAAYPSIRRSGSDINSTTASTGATLVSDNCGRGTGTGARSGANSPWFD